VQLNTELNAEFKAQKLLGKDTGALLTILLVKVSFLIHTCTVHLQVPETVKQPALAYRSRQHRFLV